VVDKSRRLMQLLCRLGRKQRSGLLLILPPEVVSSVSRSDALAEQVREDFMKFSRSFPRRTFTSFCEEGVKAFFSRHGREVITRLLPKAEQSGFEESLDSILTEGGTKQ